MDTTEILTQLPPSHLGALILLVIVLYKALDIVKTLVISKFVPNPGPTPQMLCQTDPMHFQRIKEIHDYTKGVAGQIAKGEFDCRWKDRDEVKDFTNVAKRQVAALESVGDELRLLRQELVLTRNGGSKRD